MTDGRSADKIGRLSSA